MRSSKAWILPVLAAVAAGLMTASAAQATSLGSVDLRYASCAPSETGYLYVNNVNLGNVYVGVYNLEFNTAPGSYSGPLGTALIDSLVEKNTTMAGSFCIDIHQNAPQGATFRDYEIVSLDDLYTGDDAYKANALRSLFKGHWSGVTSDSTAAAAFQAAVWEIINENTGSWKVDYSDGDAVRGSFYVKETSGSNWGGDATALLAGLGNYSPANANVFALVNGTWQDYALIVIPENPDPTEENGAVPEPITLAGLFLGLAGVGGYIRRRRGGR